MSHTLIIGYGNPLRGDDGFGPRAAELLADGDGVTPPLRPTACRSSSITNSPSSSRRRSPWPTGSS